METNSDLFTAEQLKYLLDAPGICLFAVDRDYRYVNFNRLYCATMRELWGVDPIVGMDLVREVIQDEYDRRKAKSHFDRAFAGEELVKIETCGAGVSRRLYECHYRPIWSESGGVVGATVFASDVTERLKQAEERLELDRRLLEASQLVSLGMLVSCIAHDFNNLLVPILLTNEVARSTVDASHPASELLATAIESAKSAADLTKQLQSFSGRGVAATEMVDLNSLIKSTSEMSRVSVHRRAELEVSLSNQPLRVFANPTQMRQVITNLLINASEATHGVFPRVRISTSLVQVTGSFDCQVAYPSQIASGDYAVFAVADNGCGIELEHLEHIFEPFFSTKGPSRGFGLTGVRAIVSNHGGFVAIDSQVGKGSTFKVGIPLAAADTLDICESSVSSVSEGMEYIALPKKILVAEDNAGVRKCLTFVLEKLGHEVVHFSSGIAAVVAISTQQFDLILLDAEMRDTACQEILGAMPEFLTTPIALMHTDTLDTTLLANPRVHYTLAKPFSLESLLAVLKSCELPSNANFPKSEQIPSQSIPNESRHFPHVRFGPNPVAQPTLGRASQLKGE